MMLKENQGYTLIEIILAITILGLVLVPMFGYMTSSSGIIIYADEREHAFLLAQQEMERIKSLGFDSIDSSLEESNKTIVDTDYPDINLDRYPTFERSITITGDSDIKTINIIFNWDTNKEITLKNKIAKR